LTERPPLDSPIRQARARHWLRPTGLRVLVVLALVLAVWGWFDVRVRGTVDPNSMIHKTDFTVYTEAGAAFFDGRDPYKVTNPRGWGYLYPPLFAMLVAPLHVLEPQTQVLVWFGLSIMMTWGCYAECLRVARAAMPGEPDRGVFGPIPNWIGAAAIAAALFPALNCLQRGQVGIAKLYLLLLGLRLLMESRSLARSFLGGGVMSLAIVLKFTPLVPVAIVLVQELVAAWRDPDRRALLPRAGACSAGTLGGLALFLFLVPACLVGWSTNLRHLNSWTQWISHAGEIRTDDTFTGDNTSPRNQSFGNAAHHLGNWVHYYFAGGPNDEGPEQLRLGGKGLLMDAPWARRIILAIRLAAGCLLLPMGFRLGRADDVLGRVAGFGLACLATLIISPVARAHYYVLVFPAVIFVSLWLVRHGRPRAALCSAIVPAALVIAHYAAIHIVGRVGLLGLGATVWFFWATITLVLERKPTATRQHLPLEAPQPAGAHDRPLAA
jgi:hypothetical protein